MDRKEFLKKMGIASGSMLLLCGNNSTEQSPCKRPGQKEVDELDKFKEAWITALMENLEEQLDKNARKKLMETCGRDCARRSTVLPVAKSCNGDVSKLVNSLANFLGKENCYLDGNEVFVRYPKCYCELVQKGPDRLPDTYCICSSGWLLEMYEAASQKPVKVDILKTIKRGDSCCEFIVHL